MIDQVMLLNKQDSRFTDSLKILCSSFSANLFRIVRVPAPLLLVCHCFHWTSCLCHSHQYSEQSGTLVMWRSPDQFMWPSRVAYPEATFFIVVFMSTRDAWDTISCIAQPAKVCPFYSDGVCMLQAIYDIRQPDVCFISQALVQNINPFME